MSVNGNGGLDMELIGRRIVELAALALEEHVAAIQRSQADHLLAMAAEMESDENRPTAMWN